MTGLKKIPVYAAAAALFFLLPSCGIFYKTDKEGSGPYDSKLTEELIATVKNRNVDVKSFKGKGRAKIRKNGRTSSFRLAWMGLAPLKLRLAVLSSGRLLETVATDGSYIYLRSETGEHQFYKHRTGNPDLDRMLEIPVKVDILMDLMCGRIKLLSFDTALLQADQPGQGHTIVLKKKWKGVVEKIYLDRDNRAYRAEFFNQNQSLSYYAEFKKMADIRGHSMPEHIYISNGKDVSVNLFIEKTYINPSLPPAKFILTDR